LLKKRDSSGELDSRPAKEIISLLQGISERKKATLAVATHDEKITAAADMVYTMQDGRLKAED
jgi:ABC-type lipoprotein export system ATPase subunit